MRNLSKFFYFPLIIGVLAAQAQNAGKSDRPIALEGDFLHYVEPQFPQEVLDAGVQNTTTPEAGFTAAQTTCVYQLQLNADGKVSHAIFKIGDSELCLSVEDALRKSQFRPAVANGKNVSTQRTVKTDFVLWFDDASGKRYTVDDVRRIYDTKYQEWLNPNPYNKCVHRVIYFKDKSGRIFIAGYRNGANLSRSPGDPQNFVVMRVPLEEIKAYLKPYEARMSLEEITRMRSRFTVIEFLFRAASCGGGREFWGLQEDATAAPALSDVH